MTSDPDHASTALLDQLRTAMGRMEIALGEVLESIVWTDPEGRIEWCNAAFERLLGRPRIVVLGGRLHELVRLEAEDGTELPSDGHPFNGAGEGIPTKPRTFRWNGPGGRLYLEIVSSQLDESHGRPLRFFAIRDVTQRHSLMDELRHRALYDPVTGLANRTLFADRIGMAINRARRHPRPIGVLFLDVDDFKLVNDSLGHEAGDRALRAIGERIGSVLRPSDTLARIAGDEFAILLDDLETAAAAEDVARRVTAAFRSPLMIDDRELSLSLSVGVDVAIEGRGSPEDLITNADFAMYLGKKAGKGQWCRYDPADRESAHRRNAIIDELRGAATRGELVLHYQPIVDLATGNVEALEALVRWQHPQRGLLMPADFIRIAEETGSIVEVGAWVLQTACRDLRAWHDDQPGLSVSVNLSTRQLRDDGLIELVERTIETIGLDPSRLILEVTESFLLHDEDDAVARLTRLKSLGVRLAFDDFGTGYSSLSHLRRMPIDILKVDRQFIDDIGAPEGLRFLESIVDLGQSVGVSLVAEGIERPEQVPTLLAASVISGQGYFLARPMPAAAIAPLLRSGLRLASVVGRSSAAQAQGGTDSTAT